jgi:hypothetical protein
MACPVCLTSCSVVPDPPWLGMACPKCGPYRITVPAAGVVGLYSAQLCQRVSSLLHRSALEGSPLDVDLEVLEELAFGDRRTIY